VRSHLTNEKQKKVLSHIETNKMNSYFNPGITKEGLNSSVCLMV
jgi:hypothetical protein